VESMATEKDGLAKRIAELESKLQATKEREVSKELEMELLLYKKDVME